MDKHITDKHLEEAVKKRRHKARLQRLRAAAAELLEAFEAEYHLDEVIHIYLACSHENGRTERWVGASYTDGSAAGLVDFSRKDRLL